MMRALVALGLVAWIGSAIGGCRANTPGTAECEPGHQIFVGCGCQSVGTCDDDPDPVIRVCDGGDDAEPCAWDNQLGENDDGGPTCGRCPGVTVLCPPSGRLHVEPRGLYPDDVVTCDWDVRDDGPPI